MADELAEAELARVQRLVHALCCRDRLSPQLAADRLTAYGVRRTPELIRRDLEAASCESCAAQAAQAEPQAQPEPVRPVVHPAVSSGYLTGMIERDG